MKIVTNGFISLIFVLNVAMSAAMAGSAGTIPVNPNPNITPGELCDPQDPDFDGYRYAEKMPYCKRKVSGSDKKRIYAAYGIPEKCKHRYTVDHFAPLALGGNNSDQNLWPEHVLVKATRQQLEQELYLKVVNGDMTSDEARDILIEEKVHLDLDLSDVEGCG